MCSAEDDLRGAEREIEKMGDKLDQMLRLIEDAERGIWSLAEARRKADDIVTGARVYA